ncbi:hypothetical protein LWC08_00385 [Desulfobaculum bizertense]|uniref:Rossmann-like domain-containing protein n=1 Tax=Desulfobaculum bizertense TaxID=376490 RepID=UPI001EEDBD9F|nr:DUF364 domain-containing protein [Desulfobaculum bizertense]UIJ38054.1 hypothetical protein LWC08_00385 [Desulfobaculum bizertense]
MQENILHELVESVQDIPDSPVTGSVCGRYMVGIKGQKAGLATRIGHKGPYPAPLTTEGLPDTLHGMVWLLTAPEKELPHPEARVFGIAALNALLPIPDGVEESKGQDMIVKHAIGQRVVVVGHFPFVEKIGQKNGGFASFHTLELVPRPGDLSTDYAEDMIPRAGFVAITGTTLLNGTLAGLLEFCRPSTHVMLLGPSVPFSPILLDMGLSSLAGCEITNAELAFAGIKKGLPFKDIAGTRSIIWKES